MNNLLAPLTGKLMPLDQVPDDVFAQKVLGDGQLVHSVYVQRAGEHHIHDLANLARR